LFIDTRVSSAEYLPRAPLRDDCGVTSHQKKLRYSVPATIYALPNGNQACGYSKALPGIYPLDPNFLQQVKIYENGIAARAIRRGDLYSAESQIIKALPKMIKGASSKELKSGFAEHLEQTKGHVQRLETIFKELDESPKGKKCKGMEGVIADGAELLEEDAEPEVLDAGLIGAAQHVEHYEIAGYGCVRTYAELLGENKAAKLLQQTLDEEKETDEKLTGLARKINVEAEKAA